MNATVDSATERLFVLRVDAGVVGMANARAQAFFERTGRGYSAMRVLRKTVTGSPAPVTPSSS